MFPTKLSLLHSPSHDVPDAPNLTLISLQTTKIRPFKFSFNFVWPLWTGLPYKKHSNRRGTTQRFASFQVSQNAAPIFDGTSSRYIMIGLMHLVGPRCRGHSGFSPRMYGNTTSSPAREEIPLELIEPNLTASLSLRLLVNTGRSPSASRDNVISGCLLYTSPSPRDGLLSRMPSSA